MSNQRDYFCNKINEINENEIYLKYLCELKKLKSNVEYKSLLDNISKDDSNYLANKIKIKKYEKDVKKYEKQINTYLKYILDKYNKLIKKNSFDAKVSKEIKW